MNADFVLTESQITWSAAEGRRENIAQNSEQQRERARQREKKNDQRNRSGSEQQDEQQEQEQVQRVKVRGRQTAEQRQQTRSIQRHHRAKVDQNTQTLQDNKGQGPRRRDQHPPTHTEREREKENGGINQPTKAQESGHTHTHHKAAYNTAP